MTDEQRQQEGARLVEDGRRIATLFRQGSLTEGQFATAMGALQDAARRLDAVADREDQ